MSVLSLVLAIVWLPLAFAVAYLVILTTAAIMPRRRLPAAKQLRAFRVIVPAHNEALVIEPVLRKLMSVDYPREKFEVVLVADNCTDETAAVGRRVGVRVIERFDPTNRGKGHALAHAFATLRGETFDAYVILDADTLVDEHLLSAMNRYLDQGYRAIQGHYDVLNPWETRRTALMYIALRVFNYVRPLGRRALGLSTGLQGNGMCFAKTLIDRYAWNAFSLAEDIEYTTTLVLNHERVIFAPEVKVWAQMPAARAQATTQRMRWEGGRLQLARRDGFMLVAHGLRRLDKRVLDWGIDLLIPPLAALVLAVLAGAAVSVLGLSLGAPWATPILAAWGGLALALALFVIAALVAGRVPRQGYAALLNAPLYVLWKLWIYGQILFRRAPRTWVRTERTQMVDR